jgi:hypothetical protein
VDFRLNLNEANVMAKLQSHGRSETFELSELVSLSQSVKMKRAFMEELDAFKQVHISFGRGPGPRTGVLNSAGEFSLYHFYQQAFLASQWPLFRVLTWLTDNNFPPVYQAVFRERRIHGHAFFRLQDDTEELKWRCIREFESGTLIPTYNMLSLAEFREELDEELDRLSRLIRDALDLTKKMMDDVVDQDA